LPSNWNVLIITFIALTELNQVSVENLINSLVAREIMPLVVFIVCFVVIPNAIIFYIFYSQRNSIKLQEFCERNRKKITVIAVVATIVGNGMAIFFMLMAFGVIFPHRVPNPPTRVSFELPEREPLKFKKRSHIKMTDFSTPISDKSTDLVPPAKQVEPGK
jgi:hypothetical protein